MMLGMLAHATAAFACRMAIDHGVIHGHWAWLAVVVNAAAATTYGIAMWRQEIAESKR